MQTTSCTLLGMKFSLYPVLQELGLEDIARMDGWVRTTQPEPHLSILDPLRLSSDEGQADESSSGSTDSSSDSDLPQSQDSDSRMLPQASDSELSIESISHDQPQPPKPIEYLSDDMYTYSAAPTASAAVPILSAEYSASGDFSSYDMLGQPEAASSELRAAELESADMASVSTDSEEDEEGSLLDRWYAAHPDELCR